MANRYFPMVVAFTCSVMVAIGAVFAWDRQPASDADQPQPVPQLKFADAELGRFHERCQQAAQNLSGPDWIHTPTFNDHARNGGYWYKEIWSKTAPKWDKGSGTLINPNRMVTVSATPGVTPAAPEINRMVDIMAINLPAKGWGARCDFNTRGPDASQRIELTLFLCLKPGDVRTIIQLPGGRCGGSRVYNGLRFRFGASIPRVPGSRTVHAMLDSPESFREFALAEQDRLEQHVRTLHEQNKLINAFVTSANWSPRDGKPQPTDEAKRQLTPEQKQQIFNDAMGQIHGHRAQIRKDFQAMHTAALATFPLLKCLE